MEFEAILKQARFAQVGFIVKDVAIEIVKHGDVSDDVCEWKQDNMCETVYRVCSGGFTSAYQKDFKFCPYCGKKIKIVGDWVIDGDGFITIAELLAAFKKIGIMMKDNENRSMIQYLQAGDTNNRVDIKNFAKHFVRKKSKVDENLIRQ